ncbi:three-Cys-motif partner protein TcmP [Mycobacteroides abscessus]|uniref:three-Cys-motif partner protein TcmP n=1 Tax=Mycobacteroides abscessus TaxID=36809 RepID=UPI000C2608D3|nr:three-Cys-motif partner protein TcmP [Mycobacteroides abscessus]
MAPKTVPWDAEPHTKMKHELYEQYLIRWMPIMSRGWGGDVTYAEGFAGPGIYTDGSPGSPVIALRAILDDPKLRTTSRKMRLLFVDHEPKCTTLLDERLTAAAAPVALQNLPKYGITVDIKTGECVPTLEQLLTAHSAWGRPMLVVLDTWGSAVPLDLVRRVAENGNSEVIITVLPQYFSRFAEVSDLTQGDEVFGGTGWRKVAEQPSETKARWLLQHYRETIRAAGFDYVLDFELIDLRGKSLYLVFGTTHVLGLTKMKEAMWAVDSVSGAGYRDPRDPDQQTLEIEIEPNTEPLKRLIVARLRAAGTQWTTVRTLRHFALYRTVFKASQVKPLLETMAANGELKSDRVDGKVGYQSSVRLP